MTSPLPTWAFYTPHETRGRPSRAVLTRLRTLADLPGLSLRQKALLVHRSTDWLTQFKTQPDATPLTTITLSEAIALYRVLGHNQISTPFLCDQLKQGADIREIWGFTATETRAAITRARKGKSIWF